VKNHTDLIRSEYYLGEVGGYSISFGGKRIYPIQVGEKGSFWIRVKFYGRAGHGSIPHPENVHYQLSDFLTRIQNRRLPQHVTKTSKAFMDFCGETMGRLATLQFKALQTAMGPLLL